MAEPLLRINPNLDAMMRARLAGRMTKVVDRVFAALKRWGQEWSRRASRVTPVETGTLRRSYFVIPIRQGNTLTIILANHMKYGKWLEFGTKFIARGAVLAWRPGQPVIVTWPAKMANLRPPSAKAKATTHARYQALLAKAMGPQGESMPMVRPTGYEIVPLIAREIETIIHDELSRP